MNTTAELDLQSAARDHLWLHFTRMGGYHDGDVPIIVRGDGCYVWDIHGNRYLDGLSALFCVNSGHGRTELGDAAAAQVRELDFVTVWSYAHPRAIELATRIAALAPGDLNRVFFTNSGSEAVESALKLARSYHRMRGNGQKIKVVAREIAYHGTTLGALSATGIPALRSQFEPLAPGGVLLYETFTREHAARGHPRNPDFLLEPGELRARLSALTILREREGEYGGGMVASIAARRP